MATWKALIEKVEKHLGESIIKITLTDSEYVEEFDNGYGEEEGRPFTAWTENYVLFPICYDGAECVGYAPRNPCDIKMHHQGGG